MKTMTSAELAEFTATRDARLATADRLAASHYAGASHARLFFEYQLGVAYQGGVSMTDADLIAAYEAYRKVPAESQKWDERYEASAGRDTRTDRQVARERMVARWAAMSDEERAEEAAMAAD